jgi:hypothetical protein
MKLLPLTSGILIGTFGIAATAIGIQYYNKCDKLKDDKAMTRNRNFLIAILVMSILAMLVFGFFGFKKGKKVVNRYNAGASMDY